MTSVIPYNPLNYAMGITDIKLTHFMIGHIGLLPILTVHVLMGTTLSSLTDSLKEDTESEFDSFSLYFSIALNVFSIILLICVVKKLKKMLNT